VSLSVTHHHTGFGVVLIRQGLKPISPCMQMTPMTFSLCFCISRPAMKGDHVLKTTTTELHISASKKALLQG